ncbi:MAG: FAD-dependent oxidoreductase [Firmicutes bacterium]|nr:FAD-dependent oxidoreductase [Bacillota bacterium]
MSKIYDSIIVGGGPAGITAAVYALRAGLKVLLIERQVIGGQIFITDSLKNYPGFTEISGADFSTKLIEQAESLGLEIIYDTAVEFKLSAEVKEIVTGGSGTYFGKTVILSMGASAKGLNLPNEQNYIGKGISYCATCDGAFFKDKTVAVVGGGNSAVQDVLYLSKIAKKVYHIHRMSPFRADEENLAALRALVAKKGSNVEQVLSVNVLGLVGSKKLEGIKVQALGCKTETLAVDGVFVAIGREPQTNAISAQINLNKQGYIAADQRMHTNIAGVFAAGDVVDKSLRQVVTAASDGAIAATEASSYLRSTKK